MTTGRRFHPDLEGIEPDAEQAKRIRRSVFATRLFQVAFVVFMLVYGSALMWMLVIHTQEQGAAAERAADIKATLKLIEDCTTPGGQCFETAQDRTAEAVRTINLVTIYSTGCTEFEDLSEMSDLKTCVADFLAHTEVEVSP